MNTMEDISSISSIFNLSLISLTIVLTYLILNFTIKSPVKKSRLPPGPRRLPLIGNLLQIIKNPHLKMSQWAKQYGNSCTIHLGPEPALLVSDPKLMKEIFGTYASTGKFKTDTVLLITQGPYGVANTEGKAWFEQRQFCVRSLRELGFGKRSMEPLILQAAEEICQCIQDIQKKNQTKNIVVDVLLKEATLTTLWKLASGEKVKLGDSQIGKRMHKFEEALQYTVKSGLMYFPWLKYLAPRLSGFVALDNFGREMHEFIEKKFKEHRQTYVEGERRDLIDMYIEHLLETEKRKTDQMQSTFKGKEGFKNSASAIVELFVAGGETSSATLKWTLLHLSHNQQAQRTLQKEIDEVVSKGRGYPSLEDRARMPYTEAVILETLRISSIVPFGVIHRLLDDLPLHDYVLPKGMLLIPNMYHIHHNPDIWGDPEVFRPERFMAGDTGYLKECLVPFQAGKRQCLGEPLARDILFLFVIKLFQHFDVSPVAGISMEDYLEPNAGFALLPKPWELVMNSRLN